MPISDNLFWAIDIAAGIVFILASVMFWITRTSVDNGREVPDQSGLVGASDQDRQTVADQGTV
jgi:hypothetical protein